MYSTHCYQIYKIPTDLDSVGPGMIMLLLVQCNYIIMEIFACGITLQLNSPTKYKHIYILDLCFLKFIVTWVLRLYQVISRKYLNIQNIVKTIMQFLGHIPKIKYSERIFQKYLEFTELWMKNNKFR